MSKELEVIFRELGIAQYLDIFVEQGFDSWDTILDIQESDLDALGVKLGHRRKLQRRIANDRGTAPSIRLVSPIKPTVEEANQGARNEPARVENAAEAPVVTKRKYRRHPKLDENAPERPPSAYVLFSNKLREGLKGQTLTFTEIAKLVGENWQSLTPTEREKFESQANAAKERHHNEMAQYKKTAEFRKYTKYLQEFKEKQGKPSQGQEPTKRAKAEQTQVGNGSTVTGSTITDSTSATATAAAGGYTTVASASSSERVRESASREPPPSQRQDSVHSAASSTAHDSVPSPRTAHSDVGTPKRGGHRHTRRASALRGRGRGDAPHQRLPSLSDVLVDSQRGFGRPTAAEGRGLVPGFIPANHQHSISQRPQRSPPLLPGSVPPFLHHDLSSSCSSALAGSMSSYSRKSSEGPLAIHALLSDQSTATPQGYEKSPSSATSVVSSIEQGKPLFGHFQRPTGYGFQTPSSAFQHMKFEESGDGDMLMTSPDEPSVDAGDNGKRGFDGMNALLRAGEIVGRSNRS